MHRVNKFLSVNIEAWIYGTIGKVEEEGIDWNTAWKSTYRELGGKSKNSGKKGCPMIGAQTLYRLGRIKGSRMPYKNLPIRDIFNKYSKNGVYSILTIEYLVHDSSIAMKDLWPRIQQRFQEELDQEPAQSNQGGPTVAFKLWHLNLIID